MAGDFPYFLIIKMCLQYAGNITLMVKVRTEKIENLARFLYLQFGPRCMTHIVFGTVIPAAFPIRLVA